MAGRRTGGVLEEGGGARNGGHERRSLAGTRGGD